MSKRTGYHGQLSLDVLSMDAQRDILSKHHKGWSFPELQRFIEETEHLKFSVPTITKWVKRRRETLSHMVYGSPEFKNTVATEYAKIILNARVVTDTILETIIDIRQVFKEEKSKLKGVAQLNTTAMTFLEYFKEIKLLLKETAGVEELDVDISSSIETLRADGMIKKIRRVSPDD